MRFVLAHGETAATIMAATVADLTGTPGAVVVTRGPGLASAVNGIAHAALDRLPVLVIADTVPARDRDRISHQRIDQDALGRSVAKATVTLGAREPERAADLAVRLSVTPPAGPVVVTMDPDAEEASTGPGPQEEAAPPADLTPLAAALRDARRPAVLLGLGAISHARAVRAALAGSGIPALPTYRARGVMPDSSAEAAGLLSGGTVESPLLAAADLIVGLGADPVELIPAAWDYPARTLLVTEYPAGSAAYFTGGRELIAPLPAALEILREHRAAGNDWNAAAGRTAKQHAAGRLRRAGPPAAPGSLKPAGRGHRGPRARPGRGHHHRRFRGPHARGHAVVGSRRAAPAADLQRPGHHGLRPSRRDRGRPVPAGRIRSSPSPGTAAWG